MKRMLIVDDSASWRRYHEDAIRQIYKDKFEIETADSALNANDVIYANEKTPFDIILTDMQMESNFLPLFAGEWFIEQIQKMPSYNNTRIIIISASNNIKFIAEKYGVDYIPKYQCRNIETYLTIDPSYLLY